MNSHPAPLRFFVKSHEYNILSQRTHVFLKLRTGLLKTKTSGINQKRRNLSSEVGQWYEGDKENASIS